MILDATTIMMMNMFSWNPTSGKECSANEMQLTTGQQTHRHAALCLPTYLCIYHLHVL